jgi:hypothetical protein
MAIARKPKPPKQPDEATVQQLINKGGSVASAPTPERGAVELSPVLLRLPSDMLAKIDAAVQRRRPVRISRQAWIIETLQQRLEREE